MRCCLCLTRRSQVRLLFGILRFFSSKPLVSLTKKHFFQGCITSVEALLEANIVYSETYHIELSRTLVPLNE